MKLQLTVNSDQRDGFKLNVQTETKEELEDLKPILDALISKITKISVEVTNHQDEY